MATSESPPVVTRLTIFPIKSLTGHSVESVEVRPSGALAGDRRYALVDREGRFLNGKRTAAMHQITAIYDETLTAVTLKAADDTREFVLGQENRHVASWCSRILELECSLIENPGQGFPDDLDSPGPTLLGTGTILEVASWYPGVNVDEMRRRLRMNIELASEQSFWEDGLVHDSDRQGTFRLGRSVWRATGICQRCAVPTRDSSSGIVTPEFVRTFRFQRERTLPAWAPRARFDHFYRLGINTQLVSWTPGAIHVGSPLELLEDDRR